MINNRQQIFDAGWLINFFFRHLKLNINIVWWEIVVIVLVSFSTFTFIHYRLHRLQRFMVLSAIKCHRRWIIELMWLLTQQFTQRQNRFFILTRLSSHSIHTTRPMNERTNEIVLWEMWIYWMEMRKLFLKWLNTLLNTGKYLSRLNLSLYNNLLATECSMRK